MSSKCTISASSSLHLFRCANTWDDDGHHAICLATHGSTDTYTSQPRVSRKDLEELYRDLKVYFEEGGLDTAKGLLREIIADHEALLRLDPERKEWSLVTRARKLLERP
jgi:hypothetical protein